MSRDYKEEETAARRDRQAGEYLDRFVDGWLARDGCEVHSMLFKNRGGEYLLIAKRYNTEKNIEVCFTSGESMASALRRWVKAYHHEELKWKPEEPWKP